MRLLATLSLGAVLLAGVCPRLGVAQPVRPDTTATRPAGSLAVADSLPPGHPNRVPYRSDRSFLEHVAAAPSYALHYATRPLAWVVKEAEERFPQVFEGQLPSYGLYPIFETGGHSRFAGGVVLFYDDLPWGGHDVDVRALVGSRIYNRVEARYEVPGTLNNTTLLRLSGRYANDPRVRFFMGGNDAGPEDRAFYASRETDLQLEAATDWSPRVATESHVRFQRVLIDPEDVRPDGDANETPLSDDVPGRTTTSLASTEAVLALDLTSQTARSVEGTRLRLGAEYARGLGTGGPEEDAHFLRYQVEAVQFVPLPFLPPQRRLALRGLLEKAAALGGGQVPFYRLPRLGGTRRLRGYRTNRFQDEGALLLTAEYRWPVWDNLDAVLFAEGGQVFGGYGDLATRRFHGSYGGGFHLVTGSKLAFRFELAGSPEGLRTLLTVQPAF